MRQFTVTIPDEYYDSLIEFLKTNPDVLIDEGREKYNLSERIKNTKPED